MIGKKVKQVGMGKPNLKLTGIINQKLQRDGNI
jgi:hypothetical protein